MTDEFGPLRIVRPDDLLNVTVELTNLRVSADRHFLERVDPAAPAWLGFVLPPQHLSEQAFMEYQDSVELADRPPVKYVAAGLSRLVFALPDDAQQWPLDVASLLRWDQLSPRLAGNALPPDAKTGPPLVPPTSNETALEVPYRLLMSPDSRARWSHRPEPFMAGERYEVWHSLLRADSTEGAHTRGRPVPVRAIGFRQVGNSFAASLSVGDLEDLVTLSGNFDNRARFNDDSIKRGLTYLEWVGLVRVLGIWNRAIVPLPLQADHFAIGPLGAHVQMHGQFEFPTDTQDPAVLERVGVKTPSLRQYEHILGSGRDQWVKVVYRGYLDTGQRACLVKVTYRSFEPMVAGGGVGPQGPFALFGTRAYLRQYYQVVVEEPTIDYTRLAAAYGNAGREMPIRSLRLTTLSTPKIDLPSSDPDNPDAPALDPQEIEDSHRGIWDLVHPEGPEPDEAIIGRLVQDDLERALMKPFWITSGKAKIPFGFVATDWEGRQVTATKPMLFIPFAFTKSPTSGTEVANAFTKGAGSRTVPLGGQTMAVADPSSAVAGSTAVPVDSLTFTLQPLPSRAGLPDNYLPRWVLSVESFQVHLEAVERLTGTTTAVAVTLHKAYLKDGLGIGANPAGTYLELRTPATIALGGARGGGVAQPKSVLDVVTSRQGALAKELASGAVQGGASLGAIFGGAKLFGTIDLWKILGDIPALGPDTVGLADLPQKDLTELLYGTSRLVPTPVLRSRRINGPNGQPEAIEAWFVWKPALEADPKKTSPLEVGTAQFILDSRTVTPLDGGEPETTVRGELKGFSLTFGGVVRVSMGSLVFRSLPGRKPDVSAEGVSIDFMGPLEFVNTIRDVLPDNGFSDPPAIEVTEQGITAGYTLGIPTVGVGVFSLQNLNLSAMLSVPFISKPAGLRFALSERENPFLVTVTLFGGGGFFALGVSANGVDEIEASIEFGGNVSLNLGVASGGVYVMAGVYFGKTAQACVLTGYLRCGGYLSVLGLISISLEFYLAFTWRQKSRGSEIWGQASLKVSVKICCFSKSVTLSIERRFAGASGDPSLDDVLTPADWETYCLAYAPEVAI